MTFKHYLLTLSCLFTLVLETFAQSCLFPEFLQRRDPWSADYKNNHQLAIFKSNKLTLTMPIEGGGVEEHDRSCFQQYKEKYLVRHTSDHGRTYGFLCMQFVPRGENVVQFKVSRIQNKTSPDLCDESNMEFDPYPFVHMAFKKNGTTQCPFTGGYNMVGNYANDSLICHDVLPLRLESECDRGSGIIFNFRKSECTPRFKTSPKERATFRTRCVTHWTQGIYTFIILQLDEDEDKHFCLRTSDPLGYIKEAYLWLKVKCDQAPVPSSDFIHLVLEKRQFPSTCADEMDFCKRSMCDADTGKHCTLTCNNCHSENQIGQCAFQEQFRGRWVDSGRDTDDVVIKIEAYSLNAGVLGKYDCLNLPGDNQPEKRVLLELSNEGCIPRYACVEMEKITSSVMKFRLSDRVNWPLSSLGNQKEQVCKAKHFSNSEGKERPPRLIINKENIKEVPCDLPERLHHGIAFKEYDNACGGCLHYESRLNANQFFVRPFNCSTEHMATRVIQYSCLATFSSSSTAYSVVVKTNKDDEEQYSYWVFDSDINDIKVLKASDAFLFEADVAHRNDYIQAHFYIMPNVNTFCKDFLLLAHFMPATTTPAPTPTAFETQLEVVINDMGDRDNSLEARPSFEGAAVSGPQTHSSKAEHGRGRGSPRVAARGALLVLSTLTSYLIALRTCRVNFWLKIT